MIPNIAPHMGILFAGTNYKQMFAKMDRKFGSRSMSHKRKLTEGIRGLEKRHLVPSQVGIFSNKMQATLDRQQAALDRQTVPRKIRQPQQEVSRSQRNIGRSSGLSIRSRFRNKALARRRSKSRAFTK